MGSGQSATSEDATADNHRCGFTVAIPQMPNMLGFHTEPKFAFHNTQRQQPKLAVSLWGSICGCTGFNTNVCSCLFSSDSQIA